MTSAGCSPVGQVEFPSHDDSVRGLSQSGVGTVPRRRLRISRAQRMPWPTACPSSSRVRWRQDERDSAFLLEADSRPELAAHVLRLSYRGRRPSLFRAYRSAVFEPLPLTRSNVESLMSSGSERTELDFKASCDLNDRKALVEIVKDIAAFAVYGGYLVIGADDHGIPTGHLTEAHAKLFDEARLRPKVAQYVDGLTLYSQSFEFDEGWVAVVCVPPHPDGWAVMKREGAYADARDRKNTVFGAGEVFARHGSSSERWSQDDARAIRAGTRREEAAKARHELSDQFAAALTAGNAARETARGPAAALTLDLDPDALAATVIEQLCVNDTIPLRLLLTGAAARILDEASKVDGDVDGVLDRLFSLAGILVTVDRDEEAALAIDAITALYDQLVGEYGQDRQGLRGSPDAIRLKLVTRAYALGALLVRREKWSLARRLIAFTPRVSDADWWTNWLVHADVMSARAGLHNDPERHGMYRGTLLYAQEHIAALPGLRRDLLADDPAILMSLCQFSFLTCLVALETAGPRNPDPFLAQFGSIPSAQIDPIVLRVVDDPRVRQIVFPREDAELADALRDIAYNAGRMQEGMRGWWGWQDARISEFLAAHPAG